MYILQRNFSAADARDIFNLQLSYHKEWHQLGCTFPNIHCRLFKTCLNMSVNSVLCHEDLPSVFWYRKKEFLSEVGFLSCELLPGGSAGQFVSNASSWRARCNCRKWFLRPDLGTYVHCSSLGFI